MSSMSLLPEGWFIAGSKPNDYEAGVTINGFRSTAAAYLRSRVSSNGFGTIMQQFKADAYRGKRLRFSAMVHAEAVEGHAGLWMRVDRTGGGMLAFDNMHDRWIAGSTDWTSYSVVLDVAKQGSEKIAFGVLLSGAGKIRMADVRIEAVGHDVPITGKPFLRDHPINLDFELHKNEA
jgi:hypothetical protein